MHTLATGEHGDPLMAAGPVALAEVGATSHAVSGHVPCPADCPHDPPADAPPLSGHVLDVCLAILLAAASTMILRSGAGRRVPVRLAAPWGLRTMASRAPLPSAPCLFTLSVLRT